MTDSDKSYKSDFLSICEQRGFIHQCTDETDLDAMLLEGEKNAKSNSYKPVTCYIGFDCTAPSLHVGSLIQIMMLRHFQKCGHKPIVLLGGGTTKVGDPSGKDKSRQMLDAGIIEKNMAGIRNVFEQFVEFEDEFDASNNKAVIVDNDDWLGGINYVNFLRDYGKHFSINRMLTMESVKLRLDREQTLSFLEFNYMILQAYDFVELYNRYHCRLQIGGSDQWGNIINGVELFRRLSAVEVDGENAEQDNAAHNPKHEEIFGLTTPLLTTASGAKMGKTADGAVWLNEDMLSAYDYWQFWRNTEDADVGKFLRLFTELPMDEIGRLESLKDAQINDAKKVLATEATALLHGHEKAEQARKTAEEVFEKGGASASLPEVDMPEELSDQVTIVAFKLFLASGLVSSGGEARRLIKGGGARINDVQIKDAEYEVDIPQALADSDTDGAIKISSGKKKHILLKVA